MAKWGYVFCRWQAVLFFPKFTERKVYVSQSTDLTSNRVFGSLWKLPATLQLIVTAYRDSSKHSPTLLRWLSDLSPTLQSIYRSKQFVIPFNVFVHFQKTATAVAYCKRGCGLIRVNGRPLDQIEPKVLQYKLQEPILLLGKVSIAPVEAGLFLWLFSSNHVMILNLSRNWCSQWNELFPFNWPHYDSKREIHWFCVEVKHFANIVPFPIFRKNSRELISESV